MRSTKTFKGNCPQPLSIATSESEFCVNCLNAPNIDPIISEWLGNGTATGTKEVNLVRSRLLGWIVEVNVLRYKTWSASPAQYQQSECNLDVPVTCPVSSGQ